MSLNQLCLRGCDDSIVLLFFLLFSIFLEPGGWGVPEISLNLACSSSFSKECLSYMFSKLQSACPGALCKRQEPIYSFVNAKNKSTNMIAADITAAECCVIRWHNYSDL